MTTEERLDEIDRKIGSLVEVSSAIADDTLRVCFVLDELTRVEKLPPLPWDVATALVELHHATHAAKNGMEDGGGGDLKARVESLKKDVLRLREDYRNSLEGGTP